MYEYYIIQGIMSGAFIIEELTLPEESAARSAADRMLHRPDFEGDQVRVITIDGELVWDSKGEADDANNHIGSG